MYSDYKFNYDFSPGTYQAAGIPAGSAASGGIASSAAAGAGAGTWGGAGAAGIGVAGSFLSNYLAQRAAQEEKKKELQIRGIEQHTEGQNQAMNNLMGAYRAALL